MTQSTSSVRIFVRAHRLLLKVKKKWQELRGLTGQIYFDDRVDQYRGMWKSVAEHLGAEWLELDHDIWEIHLTGRSVRIYQYQLELDNPVVLQMAGRKSLIHRMLAKEGIQIPVHCCFGLDSMERASALLEAHPTGIVVKPAGGYGGKGVTTRIRSPAQIEPAAVLASLYSDELLAEKHVAGECFRLLVFNGQVLSAVRRSGVRVVGDGQQPLAELIAAQLPGIDSVQHPLAAEVALTLSSQGLSLTDTPAEGQTVLVAGFSDGTDGDAERRTVYDVEVLDEVHPEVVAAAELAARTLGSNFLGVDIIATDITRPLSETSGVVNELNTTPALHHHYDSRHEKFPRVAMTIVRNLLTDG